MYGVYTGYVQGVYRVCTRPLHRFTLLNGQTRPSTPFTPLLTPFPHRLQCFTPFSLFYVFTALPLYRITARYRIDARTRYYLIIYVLCVLRLLPLLRLSLSLPLLPPQTARIDKAKGTEKRCTPLRTVYTCYTCYTVYTVSITFTAFTTFVTVVDKRPLKHGQCGPV